ncbi:MAG: phosphomannomutase/phosphoglucomutase [Pseudomonadales bacterium]|jgi:phosphomannomutase/phosphoglucomutase
MARAKGKSAPSKAPKSRASRAANNSIWNHALIAIVTAMIGVALMTGLVWWQLVLGASETSERQQMNILNQAYVGFFNGQIEEIRTRMNALATAEDTVDALISNDRAEMAALGRRLTQQQGYALRVEIIPKGQAEMDSKGAAPISFAALDVILRAETAPFVGPEISKAQPNLVFVAQPILNDGVVRGVLFVALDRQGILFRPLTQMGNTAEFGQVKILQSIGGAEPTEVFTFGAPGTSTDAIVTDLSVPQWKLVFEPNYDALLPNNQIATLLTAVAVMLGFFLAGIAFAFSSLSRKIQHDASTLAGQLSQLLRGRSPGMETYDLPVFQQLAAGAAQISGRQTSAPAQTAALPEGKGTPADLLEEDGTGEALETQPEDLLDDDEESYLEVNVADDAKENFGIEVSEDVSPIDMGLKLSDDIFRAYDIRGITTKNLTEEVVYWIGRSFAAQASSQARDRVIVGRDGRHSSAMLRDSLTKGLNEGGCDVIDIGEVPTPLLYFATYALDTGTGIMITGSHNPPEYNGLKMMIAGETLAEESIQRLKARLYDNDLTDGDGDVEEMDLIDHYLDRVLESVAVAQPCKVVVDCGNGVAGHVAPRLIEELGCEVVPLYCNVDGDFPNHHPDPADPENLKDLIAVVKDEKADIGLAFDGDGDRLGVVTPSGDIIWPDKLLMLFAQDIVGRNPGADIIYDVKCSRHLNTLISELGGRPIMWRTGHSHMKAKLKETGALLAGEFSGHICFGERWYGFDDALYAAARLLEIIGSEDKSVDEIFAQFPETFSTPELKIQTTEKRKFEIIDALARNADWGDGTVTDIDGVRVDFADGWGLVRASNTSPVLSLRFEADGQSALDRIQKRFADALAAIDPALKFR